MKLVARISALVIYQICTVSGSALLLGGTEVWKSLIMALTPVVPVIAYLARAYFVDGKLSEKEADDAFNGTGN